VIASFTRVASNRKTGPIPNTLTEQRSCPDACPFKKDQLCYPFYTPLGFMWEALDHGGFHPGAPDKRRVRPLQWEQLCDEISRLPKHQLWRHNTAGDLPGEGDVIDIPLFDQLVKANARSKAHGFTYTHKPVGYSGQRLVNAQAIYAANKAGFRVNLSADNLEEADELADMGIGPVVVVIPSDSPSKQRTPKGRHVVACPAEEKDELGRPKIQCDRCQLCYKDRKAIVGFHAHGKRYRRVDKMLNVIQ